MAAEAVVPRSSYNAIFMVWQQDGWRNVFLNIRLPDSLKSSDLPKVEKLGQDWVKRQRPFANGVFLVGIVPTPGDDELQPGAPKSPKRPKRRPRKKSDKVHRVMHEFKHGQLHSGSKTGPLVRSRKQAIAIALSEAGLSRRKTRSKRKTK